MHTQRAHTQTQTNTYTQTEPHDLLLCLCHICKLCTPLVRITTRTHRLLPEPHKALRQVQPFTPNNLWAAQCLSAAVGAFALHAAMYICCLLGCALHAAMYICCLLGCALHAAPWAQKASLSRSSKLPAPAQCSWCMTHRQPLLGTVLDGVGARVEQV